MFLYADVLIVTVTRVEAKAVLEIFQEATGYPPKPTPIGDRIYHDLGVINNTSVFMVQSEMGAGGLGSSQQTVQKGIAALLPSAVIMVGVAFGVIEAKQAIGDILVSQRLLLYELQRVSTDEGKHKIMPRGDRIHASPWLFNRFRSADLYWDESRAKVRFGLILSGEKLVDNIDFRQQLRDLEPEAIGGEMEGAGLYVACQDSKVDWILVKGICDWADGHKAHDKGDRQKLAAHNAASFVLHVFQQAPLKPEAELQGPITSIRVHGSRITDAARNTRFPGWPRNDVSEFLKRSDYDLIAIDSAVLCHIYPASDNTDWGWNKDQIDLIHESDLVDAELPIELQEISRKLAVENPARRNSVKHCVTKFSREIIAGFRLTIRTRPITYLMAYPVAKVLAESIGDSRNRKLRELYFPRLTDYSRPLRPNMLIAHVLVVTGDSRLLLLRRKPDLDYFPNHWSATFEEHYNAPWERFLSREEMHPESLSIDTTIFGGIKRGLHEEMRLSENEIENTIIRVLGVGFEYDNFLANIHAIVELPKQLTFENMRDRLRSSIEHDRIASCAFDSDNLLPSLIYATIPKEIEHSDAKFLRQWKWHPTARMRIFLSLCRRLGMENLYEMIDNYK